jgi:hypothetical protein
MEGKTVMLLFVVFVMVLPLLFWWISVNKPLTPMEQFCSCLNKEGIVLACNDYSLDCKEQKRVFAEGFSKLDYRNCEFSKEYCQMNSISSYPAWVFPSGKKVYRIMNTTNFGRLTECSFNMTDPA